VTDGCAARMPDIHVVPDRGIPTNNAARDMAAHDSERLCGTSMAPVHWAERVDRRRSPPSRVNS
jgi:hypothetical protein